MAYRIAGLERERPTLIDKSKSTTRTYNMTVNHKLQILHCTTGHLGRWWNDKSLIRSDELRNGTITDKIMFELMTASPNGQPPHQMKGSHVIDDKGYLNWSTAVPPMMEHSMYSQS
jgi:hypothetical protein